MIRKADSGLRGRDEAEAKTGGGGEIIPAKMPIVHEIPHDCSNRSTDDHVAQVVLSIVNP